MDFIVFEDEHLLVVNKPPGVNTHAPGPFAGEGLYEWLKNREPRWASLAVIHRLDKETSGLIVFGKTTLANRSLTAQFEQRTARKIYILLTDRRPAFQELAAKSAIVRAGDKYLSRPVHAGAQIAETLFLAKGAAGSNFAWEARPLTGKTHQIRVQAAEHGFPILGDSLYGGAPAPRLYLHAARLEINHPLSGSPVTFDAAPEFDRDAGLLLRSAFIDSSTNSYRLIHGAADGWPGLYLDRLGDYLLAQSESELSPAQRLMIENHWTKYALTGVCHKLLHRKLDKISTADASPRWLLGEPPSGETQILENGKTFEMRFDEGGSVGLFLDQRQNRRRLLTRYIAPGFTIPNSYRALNAFAYTCGFSVCAAASGGRVTSLDLSKKHLEWGRRNFALNKIDTTDHDFIYGDAFEWFKRLAKQKRSYDVILLDPPTFSRSDRGTFQAEKDYGSLLAAALPLLASNGILFTSTNAALWKPEDFLQTITASAALGRRNILQQHYAPQPPDFPVHRSEPAYLKAVWTRFE